MTHDEKLAVLAAVKPVGAWKEPAQRGPAMNPPVPWEDQIGNLKPWRDHLGQGRKILPLLATEPQTTSVCNSIQMRLRKIHPDESWIAYATSDGIYLKCNGARRKFERSATGSTTVEPTGGDEERDETGASLFRKAG